MDLDHELLLHRFDQRENSTKEMALPESIEPPPDHDVLLRIDSAADRNSGSTVLVGNNPYE
jgi:hypothetical protein